MYLSAFPQKLILSALRQPYEIENFKRNLYIPYKENRPQRGSGLSQGHTTGKCFQLSGLTLCPPPGDLCRSGTGPLP